MGLGRYQCTGAMGDRGGSARNWLEPPRTSEDGEAGEDSAVSLLDAGDDEALPARVAQADPVAFDSLYVARPSAAPILMGKLDGG
jgi:hypothetical protein